MMGKPPNLRLSPVRADTDHFPVPRPFNPSKRRHFAIGGTANREAVVGIVVVPRPVRIQGDRKSTRLNSSHDQISYAVFCLKKKKNTYYTGYTIAQQV